MPGNLPKSPKPPRPRGPLPPLESTTRTRPGSSTPSVGSATVTVTSCGVGAAKAVAKSEEMKRRAGKVLVVDSNGGSGPLGFGGFGDFGRFPGFDPQQFAGFDDFPSRLPSSFGFEDDSTPEISIDLSDIFGNQPSEDGGRVPGIINTIFDALGGHLGVQIGVDGGEGTVNLHGGEGGPVAGDGEYDHQNSTFDEKTLPDGSVVRVNRTVIKDTDENGNSFFFS